MFPSNILFIVQKDTSELDFIVPLVWKIKKDSPSVNMSVLYAVINKKMILRKSTFYSGFFSKHQVAEYDLGDFMFKSLPVLGNYLRRKFTFSYWDDISKTGLCSIIKSSSIIPVHIIYGVSRTIYLIKAPP